MKYSRYQIRAKVEPESWPLKATDLNPEVPEFVPTFVSSVPQPISEEVGNSHFFYFYLNMAGIFLVLGLEM